MSTTVDAPGSTGATGRWDRATVAMLTGFAAGSAGAAALVTALGKQVYDLSGRELDLGLLGLAEFAPAALLVLVTGTIADRFERRRVAALGSLGEAAVTLVVTLYVATSPTAVGPLFALALGLGVARAFVAPASRALPADTVPAAQLPWLVARWTIVFQVALIAGPVLAGSLYAVDPRAPFVAATVLFVIAALGFALLPPADTMRARAERAAATPPPNPAPAGAAMAEATGLVAGADIPTSPGPELPAATALPPRPAAPAGAPGSLGADGTEGTDGADGAKDGVRGGGGGAEAGVGAAGVGAAGRLQEAMEGLRLVRREPILLGAISLDLFAVLFGGAVALLPAIADERLGVGAVGFGWLRAGPGIGAAAMMLALAINPVRRHVGRTLLSTVAVFGVATVVLGATTSYAVALTSLVVLGAADALSVFIRITLVPLVTPAATRGRVLAVENVFIGASNELGSFESGVTGQLLGPGPAVALGGIATLVVAGTWSRLFPALRDVDQFPTPVDEPARGP